MASFRCSNCRNLPQHVGEQIWEHCPQFTRKAIRRARWDDKKKLIEVSLSVRSRWLDFP